MVKVTVGSMEAEVSERMYEKITELSRNQKKLIVASQSLTKKKKTKNALAIKHGNIRQIVDTAYSNFAGSLGPQKDEICKKLCQILKASEGSDIVELIAFAVATIIGLGFFFESLIVSLVWMFRQRLIGKLCNCDSYAM